MKKIILILFCILLEAILLDIRSGIIAKSVVSSQDFNSVSQDNDKNFSETIKKAELKAVANALGEVALVVNRYLESVDLIAQTKLENVDSTK